MDVEGGILHLAHLLEVAVQLVGGLGREDLSKDVPEALQFVGIVGEAELAAQFVALDEVVHGDQGGLAAVEEHGGLDVGRVACLQLVASHPIGIN